MMTKTYKAMRGVWCSEDSVPVIGKHFLRVLTMKRSSGRLVTTATLEEQISSQMSQLNYGAFSRTLATTEPARITAQVCEQQHALAMTGIDAVKADALKTFKADADAAE